MRYLAGGTLHIRYCHIALHSLRKQLTHRRYGAYIAKASCDEFIDSLYPATKRYNGHTERSCRTKYTRGGLAM